VKIEVTTLPEENISCSNCRACCCRLEVMLVTDTGVPPRFIVEDEWGGRTMSRLEDGWCSALDRNSMMCSIYERRPLICRDFAMGEHECRSERAAYV
jgi:Fe-S-cluster containining protein